jgi:hypothetical protein
MAVCFLFSHLKELLRLYIILFLPFFFISCLFLQIFWSKGMTCSPSSIFVDMHARHNRGHAIFLSRQPLIILHPKLYSVCPSKYQDHSKPLQHLPINIWSATNTFIWLIPLKLNKIWKMRKFIFKWENKNLYWHFPLISFFRQLLSGNVRRHVYESLNIHKLLRKIF